MGRMRIVHVVGARPNFMKAAPVIAALQESGMARQTLVHTGQHYDVNMSRVFFSELGLPEPDMNLDVGSGTHASQTAEIMIRFEKVVEPDPPDLVLVYGDVNSTAAAALVCSKLHIAVGHVEAGLRSFDRSMPEEINRVVTDQIADLLFTPSKDGDRNLLREGVAPEKIHLAGNVMIDTLVRLLPHTEKRWEEELLRPWQGKQYALVTLHRPSNVDSLRVLERIMGALQEISAEIPVIFPVHPRTRQRLSEDSVATDAPDLFLMDPIGYLDFLALQKRAMLVITDSGGIQEETTYLGIPCFTVRENTERPVTITMGTNTLVGQDMDRLQKEVARVLAGEAKRGSVPPLWDGHAAERIAGIIGN
jgi:UDP-N-acetylglucosamine 2-epimerase (non-hydrolysing)